MMKKGSENNDIFTFETTLEIVYCLIIYREIRLRLN